VAAYNIFPSRDEASGPQLFLLPAESFLIHVTPKSVLVYIYPLRLEGFGSVQAVNLLPSEDDTRETQLNDPEPICSIQVTPKSVLVCIYPPFNPTAKFLPSEDDATHVQSREEARCVQVSPELALTNIKLLLAIATTLRPSSDEAIPFHCREPALIAAVQIITGVAEILAEGSESPIEFIATTVKIYGVPFVNPFIVVVVDVVDTFPFMLDTLYPVIAKPPFDGTFHERTTEREATAPDKVGLAGTVPGIREILDDATESPTAFTAITEKV